MRAFSTWRAPVLIALSVAAIYSVADVARSSSDAATPQPSCSEKFARTGICLASLISVASSPKLYEGKQVQFVGYVALENRFLTVYASESAFLSGDSMLSVEIEGTPDELTALAHRWAYQSAIIRGRFASGDAHDTSRERVGRLKEVQVLGPSPKGTIDKSNLDPIFRVDPEER